MSSDDRVAALREAMSALKVRWRNTPLRDRIAAACVALGAIVSQIATVLGLNFWQVSFTENNKTAGYSYVSCLIPAVIWAVAFFVPMLIMKCRLGFDTRWVWGRESLGLLIAIGTLDALGGITAVYATPHVATLVQVSLYSLGTVFTFTFTHIFVKKLAMPLSRYVIIAFLLGICGILVASYPQFASSSTPPSSPSSTLPGQNNSTTNASHPSTTTLWHHHTNVSTTTTSAAPDGNVAADESTGSKLAWILIFILSGLIPCLYCTLQARFMRQVAPTHKAATLRAALKARAAGTGASTAGNGGERVSLVRYAVEKPIVQETEDDALVASDSDDDDATGPSGVVGSTGLQDSFGGAGGGSSFGGGVAKHQPKTISPESHRHMIKLIMWTGDCGVQAIATLAMFPLDATPWFGSTTSLRASWLASVDTTKCIATCVHNGWFLAIYAAGFYFNHVFMAYLNYYSPTLASFVLNQTTPMILLLLTIVPSWAVYGNPTPWYVSLGTLMLVFLAAGLYFVLEQLHRLDVERKKQAAKAARGSRTKTVS